MRIFVPFSFRASAEILPLPETSHLWLKTTIPTQRKLNCLYRVYTCMDKIVAGAFLYPSRKTI
jgi:hypothetical protein